MQDYAEALDWYRLAAEQGDALAQNNLGGMYAKGRGVIQDDVIAHMWYNIGGANGNERGSDNRGLIEEQRLIPFAPAAPDVVRSGLPI